MSPHQNGRAIKYLTARKAVYCWMKNWGTQHIHTEEAFFERKAALYENLEKLASTKFTTHIFSNDFLLS